MCLAYFPGSYKLKKENTHRSTNKYRPNGFSRLDRQETEYVTYYSPSPIAVTSFHPFNIPCSILVFDKTLHLDFCFPYELKDQRSLLHHQSTSFILELPRAKNYIAMPLACIIVTYVMDTVLTNMLEEFYVFLICLSNLLLLQIIGGLLCKYEACGLMFYNIQQCVLINVFNSQLILLLISPPPF